MEPLDSDQQSPHDAAVPSLQSGATTPRLQGNDCPATTPTQNTNPQPDDVLGPQHAERLREIGQSQHSENCQTPRHVINESLNYTSERSWPQGDSQTGLHLYKRTHSPSDIGGLPRKRANIQHSPTLDGLSLSFSVGEFHQDQEESDIEVAGNQVNPNGHRLNRPYSYSSHSLSQPILRLEPLAAQQNHPPNQDKSPGFTPDPSTSPTRQYDADAPHVPDQRFSRTAQSTGPESSPSYENESWTPLRHREANPAQPHIASPIWNAEQQDDHDHVQYHTPRRERCDITFHLRTYPFEDGGEPGDGGSSSDEDIMLEPVVVGSQVFKGGVRKGIKVPMPKHPFAGKTFLDQPLREVAAEDLLKHRILVERRKRKLLHRDLAGSWRICKSKGDIKGMDRVERKAEKANVARAKTKPAGSPDLAEYDSTRVRSGASPFDQMGRGSAEQPSERPRSEHLPRSPRNRSGAQDSEPRSRGRGRTREFMIGTENSRNRSSKVGQRTILEIQKLVEKATAERNAAAGTTWTHDADNNDSTPLQRSIRENRQYVDEAKAMCDHSSYGIESVLPEESMTYNARSCPDHQDKGHRQFSQDSSGANAVDIDEAQPTRSNGLSKATVAKSSGFKTPSSRTRRSDSKNKVPEQPETIAISSTGNTPIRTGPSVPMKERLAPPKKKTVPKPSKTRSTVPRKEKKGETAKEGEGGEAILQQESANSDHQKDVATGRPRLEKNIFGAAIGLTAEEVKNQAESEREEAEQKQEAIKKAQLLKEEEARLAEAQKQKELEEVREKERLDKERIEQDKKAKRETERKRQLALDEQAREEKRKKTAERIEAQRAKEAAEAKEREDKKEKERTIELDQLKIENWRKSLEIKKLQAASLVGAKTSTSETAVNSSAMATPPITQTEDPDSLFLPESGSNEDPASSGGVRARVKRGTGTGTVAEISTKPSPFRSQIAEDREKWKAEQNALEAKKKADIAKVRLSTRPAQADAANETPKQPKQPKTSLPTRNSHLKLPGTPTITQPPMIGNPLQAELEFEHEPEPETRPVKAKESKVEKHQGPTLSAAKLDSTKKSSEIRLLSIIELERQLGEQKAAQAETKAEANRKHNARRRKRGAMKVAAEQRQKLVDEAEKGGYSISEEELRVRVDDLMKKREEKYEKKQAKKYGQGAGSTSVNTPLAQPEAQQHNLASEPPLEDEGEDADPGVQVETPLDKGGQAAKSGVRNGFGDAMAKATVSHFKADNKVRSDDTRRGVSVDTDQTTESEEDPDDEDTLETLRKAMMGKSQGSRQNDSVANKLVGGLDPEGLSAQLEKDLDAAFEGLTSNVSQSQKVQAQGGSSKSKSTQILSEQSTLEDLIKVYHLKVTEINNGVELDEPARPLFTDRNEANERARNVRANYLKKTAGKERSSTQNEKAGLFCCTVVLDDMNSLAVTVTFEIQPASNYGVDVTKLNVPYVQHVWAIKRKLANTVTNPETQKHITTNITEDAVDMVYTDRELANYEAARNLITFLKPTSSKVDHVTQWANVAEQIREELARQNEAGECFHLEFDRTEPENVGMLEWLDWDMAGLTVEVFDETELF